MATSRSSGITSFLAVASRRQGIIILLAAFVVGILAGFLVMAARQDGGAQTRVTNEFISLVAANYAKDGDVAAAKDMLTGLDQPPLAAVDSVLNRLSGESSPKQDTIASISRLRQAIAAQPLGTSTQTPSSSTQTSDGSPGLFILLAFVLIAIAIIVALMVSPRAREYGQSVLALFVRMPVKQTSPASRTSRSATSRSPTMRAGTSIYDEDMDRVSVRPARVGVYRPEGERIDERAEEDEIVLPRIAPQIGDLDLSVEPPPRPIQPPPPPLPTRPLATSTLEERSVSQPASVSEFGRPTMGAMVAEFLYKLGDDPFDQVQIITDPNTRLVIGACGLSSAVGLKPDGYFYAFLLWLHDYVAGDEVVRVGLISKWAEGAKVEDLRAWQEKERLSAIVVATDGTVGSLSSRRIAARFKIDQMESAEHPQLPRYGVFSTLGVRVTVSAGN